jgi:predicted Zn-ribbon and HTH transcriptional regulator
MSLPKQGCDLKMSVSTFTSDFDDKADSIDRSKHLATSKRNGDRYYKHSRYSGIFFQVCRSCFWCASNLYKIRMIERCPRCKSNRIGSLPIAVNEIYGYHHYR